MSTVAAGNAAAHPIRSTWREVWRALWPKNWKLVVGLGVMTLVLAVIPTLKSQFESATFSSISDILRDAGRGQEKPGSFLAALERQLPSYSRDADDLVTKAANALLREATLRNVVWVYLVLIVATLLAEIIGAWVRAKLTQSVLAALRARAMRNALTLETTDLTDGVNVSGQYASAIQQGSENVANMYEYWYRIGEEFLAMLIALFAISSKTDDPRFALWFLGVAVSLLGLSHWQQKLLKNKREQLDRRRNELMAQTDDVLSKREILAAYEQQGRYSEEVDKTTRTYADVSRYLSVAEARFRQISEALMDLGQLAILLAAVYLVVNSTSNIGDASFVIFLYMRLLRPISNLISRYQSLRRAQATSATFLRVFAPEPQALPKPLTVVPAPATGGIRFDNITFTYPGADKKVLDNVSFVVPGGTATLVVGPSGCGKSTIARVILGFWSAQSGKVVLNGKELSEYPSRHAIRELMSYVSQGDHIVDATIGENLSWATRTAAATPAQMLGVLQKVGLAGWKLDEKAKKMSGGEQQRLSVARLMLDQSPILILDEPLSGADVFTAAELLPWLREALKGRTALIISHKLSLACLAGHVVVLDEDGNVDEQGDPLFLLGRQMEFARIHDASVKELEIAYAEGLT